jgi:hypothetical protein
VISEEAAALISKAEVETVRVENLVMASPYADALKKALIRFESLICSHVEGKRVPLMEILRLEAVMSTCPIFNLDEKGQMEFLAKSERFSSLEVFKVYRYMQAIEWISSNAQPGTPLTPDTMLDVRRLISGNGEPMKEEVVFRSEPEHDAADAETQKACNSLLLLPKPEELDDLIVDYCDFINRDALSPIAQAAISHFQIQAIRPFVGRLEAFGRAMCHYVHFRRGLLRFTPVPLTLGPAILSLKHAHLFLHYDIDFNTGYPKECNDSDAIFKLCAEYTDLAQKAVRLYLKTAGLIQEKWRTKIGKISRGSTLDLLLNVLPGSPLLTVASAMKIVGKSFSSTNSALKALHEEGILKVERPIHMNTSYCATEVVSLYETMRSKIIPEAPIPVEDIEDTLEGVG